MSYFDRSDDISCDLLIIGSGFAGLWAAITARSRGVRDIAIVDKSAIGLSSQSKMAAGATIYCLPHHDRDLWLEDFATIQKYLCRQDMVSEMLETSYERLMKLEAWGVSYMRVPLGGYYTLHSRGFKNVRMMAVPQGGNKRGGAALVGALLRQVKTQDDFDRRIEFYPKVMITSLMEDGGRVSGAIGVRRKTGEPVKFRARAVVLAAADCSFRGNYVCVDNVTGDAFALAYDSGVRLSNMEFLATNTGPPGYGFEGTGFAAKYASFLNKDFERFMYRYHPDADRAEICYIAQAMTEEAARGNGPPFYFDMTKLPGSFITRQALLTIGNMVELNLKRLEELKVPVFTKPQEWLPVMQTLRGGVRTDLDCSSDMPGLFAAGISQAVDPGLFNGWSSMRAMWSGEKAGGSAAEFLRGSDDPAWDTERADALTRAALAPLGRESGVSPDAACLRLQDALFPYAVSIRKSEGRLLEALDEVMGIRDDVPRLSAENPHELVKVHETANMVTVAELFLKASLERRETRADHFREDHPATDNVNWLKWVNLRKGVDGRLEIEHEPVPFERYRFEPKVTAVTS